MEKLITVNDSKLNSFKQNTWIDTEEIMVAVPCEYKREKKKFTNGFLVCTYGTNYIYKQKMLNKPHLKFVFHLLDCNKFHVQGDKIVLTYDTCNVELKMQNMEEVASKMLRIFSEMTFNCKEVEFMKIQTDISIPDYKVTKRVQNSLVNRALFLSHFYNTDGEMLVSKDYFKKLDEKPTKNLVISRRLHPGNYAAPFGHAIAWETFLDTVTFQKFTALKFPRMLDALLQNSQTIDRIAFTDYNDKYTPTFEMENIDSTNIRRFWFLRCNSQTIINFFEASENLPTPMKEIVISQSAFRAQEFADIVKKITKSQSASEVKKFFVSKLKIKPFPFNDISRLLSVANYLESFIFRDVDADASSVIRAICNATTHVRVIVLTHMTFKSDIPLGIAPPNTLLSINVSNCAFKPSTFKSLFEFLCSKPAQVPFFFHGVSLAIKPEVYNSLAELNFGALYPNIAEFDFSGNNIPSEAMRYFFAFLFTQKRNHLLTLNECHPEDPPQFLSYVSKLAVSVPLLGLDLMGKYPASEFVPFIESLEQDQALRRLSLRCRSAGDAGLVAFKKLIEQLPDLNEVSGDGFKPSTPTPLFEFWKSVNEHPKIQTCGLPQEDVSSLGLTSQRMNHEMNQLFQELKKRPRMSTVSQRLEYMIQQAKKMSGMDTTDMYTTDGTSEIFEKTATMDCNDDNQNENDQLDGDDPHSEEIDLEDDSN